MKIQDYLHLYLGCTVQIPDNHIRGHELIKIHRKGTFLGFADFHRLECRIGFRAGPEGRVSTYMVKPILRPLSDLQKEEMIAIWGLPDSLEVIKKCKNKDYTVWNYRYVHDDKELNNDDGFCYSGSGIENHNPFLTTEAFLYLLSKRFDLFGLIDAELAIDETKSKQHEMG